MDYLRVATLLYSLVYVQGALPKLTLPDPIYYVNDSIGLSCDSVISADLIAVEIRINKTDTDINYFIICRYQNDKWIAPTITGPIYDDNCVNLPNSGSVNLGISIRMVERMKSSSVTCEVSYFQGGVKTVQDAKANAFSEAYVEPARLEFDKFEFDDEVPVLYKKTRARCVSYGGYPISEFIYEVRSKSDAAVHTFTELKDDKAVEFIIDDSLKNGFNVTCRDKVHTRRKISLTKQNCSGTDSDLCMPHYITSKVPSSNIVSFNPSYSNAVECDVEGYPSDRIKYSWTSDGKVVPSETASKYSIPAHNQTEEKTEILSCSATHTYGTINITWTITWSVHATTKPTATKPAAPGTSSASTAIGVGVGVGLAVVIIAVVVGVILYKKKRDNSARYQNTPPAPDSVTVSKPEKPKKTSSQTTNGGHPAYSKNDDRIIYAELDQHTLGNKQPQPAKPTPKYTQDVVYAEIDPNKTRKLANKNQ